MFVKMVFIARTSYMFYEKLLHLKGQDEKYDEGYNDVMYTIILIEVEK